MSAEGLLPSARSAASGGTLTINLDALADNFRLVQSRTKADIAACVKADGYGLGIVAAARAFAHAGCKTYFVASADEGAELRAALPDATIYVLNGLFSQSEAFLKAHHLRPCLSSLPEVKEWAQFAKRDAALPAALHVDTGIHRLGFAAEETVAVAGLARDFPVSLVLSHLACADDATHPLNKVQLDRFKAARDLLPTAPASLANTAGVLLSPDYHFDLVRPGIGLYGGNPFGTPGHPFKPVVTLTARVMRVSTISAGESVGYGATYIAARPTRVATIATGYADGYFRALGTPDGKGLCVSIDGAMAPVIGRVSMDMITVDVTQLPEHQVVRGQFVELIGENITIGAVGRAAGTIGYEVLTRLGYRYRRKYISQNGITPSV
ncbi:MAG: alanine racemase [Parvibaculum sp.]